MNSYIKVVGLMMNLVISSFIGNLYVFFYLQSKLNMFDLKFTRNSICAQMESVIQDVTFYYIFKLSCFANHWYSSQSVAF